MKFCARGTGGRWPGHKELAEGERRAVFVDGERFICAQAGDTEAGWATGAETEWNSDGTFSFVFRCEREKDIAEGRFVGCKPACCTQAAWNAEGSDHCPEWTEITLYGKVELRDEP